jgi:6-phosphogluconolactonase (cycloisomerase 2 family)
MNDAGTLGAVFVQTNKPTNAVIAFRRHADGGLERLGTYETGGAGSGDPHLPSQGSVTLTGDGRHLLVTNASSGDVSAFRVGDALELVGRTPAGPAPRSVAEHDGLVYALSTGKAAIVGLRLTEGGLEPIAGGDVALPSPDADPAQVGFSADGSVVVVTDRAANAIFTFPIGPDGSPGTPEETASSGPTPYGFACTDDGTLVVTEAFGAQKGAAAVSSYRLDGGRLTPVTRSAANGRSEICWAVATDDGRWAFTTNFADGAVSRYAIGVGGAVTLDDPAAGVTVDGRPGLRDEALTAGSDYLYALDADSGSIFGWAVGEGGALSPIGSWGGLPPTAAGLAAI